LQDSQPYLWLFIKIGLATGLRHTEILSSRFENFDPTRRRLKVWVKGGKWRQQPLTRGITDILGRERGMAADQCGWIFPSTGTASGHIEQMSAAFARSVVRAGLNPKLLTPHVMRHTAITRLAVTGADIKTIQEFSGHESLQMVLRYAHAQDRAVDSALDRMEGAEVLEHPANTKAEKG
jgi:integrase